ncbi:hypothetical protein Z043_114475 [Scleropages formosus]|uniref:Uncharacterized protein n=1 Tax=Scleropages formosus TaxID=113540 RepID=A0A0N8JYM8_SCLFO|nr:hypothetical protein Z043_114475 [Scleropages formosus]
MVTPNEQRGIFANVVLFHFQSATELKKLIQRFYVLQAERVEAYTLFEEGHEAYLRTGPHYDFLRYRQLVHEIAQAFGGISREVLDIKERLHRDFDRVDLSEHIEKLQEKEKQKLELVRCILSTGPVKILIIAWAQAECEIEEEVFLTYLVARFVGLLQPDTPLVVQLDAHATAAVGVLAYPAKELLELPPERGVLLTRLGLTGPTQQPLCQGDQGQEMGQ